MKSVALGIIDSYRAFVRPLMPPACRFTPSCSDYAHEALAVHGLAKGSFLSLRRLSRCHPWNAGGADPVPPAHLPKSAGALGRRPRPRPVPRS
ncbi:MAG: membrane protein insertion efficiency factor YidD [Elusimicrobia bacterium]|nr:membrane protein insertion efficiency factor YidD [Elusimicrobiota bacterium]